MYTQFNYYNQNNPFIKADPLIQTSFNRIGINNYQKSYINMNENYNISCQKNNIHSRLKNINEAAVFNSLIILKETLLKILDQLNSNYICKICKSINNSSTGFFCKIPYFNSTLPVLITTNHILNKEDLKVNRIIKIVLIERDKEREREKEIKIVINEPRITFTDEKLNVTIIEIIPEVDKIDNFLEVP